MSKRLAIYTCITGGYEQPKAPQTVWSEADYIFFTDTPEKYPEGSLGVWECRPVMYSGTSATQTSRWHKLNPHLALQGYDCSLWVDGNIAISGKADAGGSTLETCISGMIEDGTLIAGLRHPQHDDIYEESRRILRGRRESFCRLVETTRFLSREGMPRHFGMMETNVLFRRHTAPEVLAFDKLWWEMLQEHSSRDQLSQSYCLWKLGIEASYILPEGYSARNHEWFEYTDHSRPYVKDRSLKGIWKDAVSRIQRCVFDLWLKMITKTE